MEQRIGRYGILGQLGRGAMGVVYLAEDPTLNRQVAIKMVDVSVEAGSQQEFLRSRLLRDARAAAALTHPSIVTVYDVLEEGGKAYVVMEYIAGESLSALLKKTSVPDSAFTLRILRDMAAALDYTHGREIIHRDIKPANVMIDPRGSAKIMDFGIARFHEAQGGTVTGMVMGTIEYMAPEQVKGEPLDGRADQFALGAVAYQMLSGSTLFGEHSFTTLAYKLVNEEPPPVCTRNPALPAPVDAALRKALSKKPQDRFPSCTGFVEALATALSGGAVSSEEATRVIPAPVMPETPKKKVPLGAVAALVGALVLAVAGWLLWKSRTSEPAPATTANSIPVPSAPMASAESPPTVQPEKPRPAVKEPPARAAVRPAPETPIPQEEPVPDTEEPSAPGPAGELYDRAQIEIKNGQYAGAVQSLNKAIAIRPDFAKALLSRGMAHLRMNQTQAAIEDYSTVIRLRPRKPLAYYERGVCHARLQENDLALADYDRALQLKPDMHLALNARGMVFLKQNRNQKAIADFTESIRLAPNFGPAYQNRGRARQAIGDLAGARADMDKADQLRGRQTPDRR